MKRSERVVAPLLGAAALAVMSGCRAPEMQRCVDEQNHVVAESFCQANGVAPVTTGPMGYFPHYRYYYGGGGGWTPGTTVFGGSYDSLSGHSYTRSSAAAHSESIGGHVTSGTSRGGFGSTHGGDAGGGHGGGGE